MRLLAIVVGLCAVTFAASEARAQDATCDVYEIEAHNDGGAVDKGLEPLAAKFKKPPFTSWKAFRLLKKHSKPAELKKPVSYKLTPGGKLELTLKDKDQAKGKKVRFRVGAAISDKQGKERVSTTSRIDSGDPWFIGGEPLPNKPKSTYFVGIVCTK
jgi:hypothetical protein